jgi:hypothetical protein
MAKFGSLFINGGRWNSRQILSPQWIDQSFKRYTDVGDNPYGYHWWIDTFYVNGQKVLCPNARGHYGQFLFIFPSLEMVCVVTSAENENHQWDQPVDMVAKYLLPAALPPSMESFKSKAVSVQKKILEEYAGIYRHKEDRYGMVARKGISLYFKISGRIFQKLFATSTTDFHSENNNIMLVFSSRENETISEY